MESTQNQSSTTEVNLSGVAVHCAHDALVDITELIPNPRNPNKHGDKQVALLAKIIRHQGWRAPITVSKRSGFIVTGHGRLEAAKLLQVQTVPVDFQDFATEADEWAHLVADNRIAELAEIDSGELSGLLKELEAAGVDLDLAGFDAEALVEVEGFDVPESDVDAEPQIDRAAELQKEWGTETGQLWSLGDHRLLCGDSTKREDVERVMGGERAGLCFTSPPYGQQRDYRDGVNEKCSDWDKLMRGVFGVLPMSESGQVLVNLGLIHSEGEWLPYWDKWIEWMREQGWRRFGFYVWDQMHGLRGDWAGRFAPSHEFIFHFNKVALKPCKWVESLHAGERGGALRNKNGTFNEVTTDEIQSHKLPDSVWRIQRQKGGIDGHPAPFSVALVVHALNSWPGIAYEPFLGSGTTLIAAEGLGRKCYGLEISPGYCAVILQRFKDATGKTPTLTPC